MFLFNVFIKVTSGGYHSLTFGSINRNLKLKAKRVKEKDKEEVDTKKKWWW